MSRKKLIGPFRQVLTMDHLPLKGALSDDHLEVLRDAGILMQDGIIISILPFHQYLTNEPECDIEIEYLDGDYTLIPGLIDAHTHICFAGSRAMDHAMKLSGKSYLEIAALGGGINNTVSKTREAGFDELLDLTRERAIVALKNGVTTLEVKSGYGLDIQNELKMLRVIKALDQQLDMTFVSTCLAAHTVPSDFARTPESYLRWILNELLPIVRKENLSNRVDIFVEKSAFGRNESDVYLQAVKELGFDITVHADQFTTGGSELALKWNASSADHLEASTSKEIELLAQGDTVAVCLPGASIGLGEPFAPARKLLDAGAMVAIASDWNPGTAPMGDLLLQASVFAAYEKLTTAEVFAGITFRAAKALNMPDKGILKSGNQADFIAFPTADYREILYHQGMMKPEMVWVKGNRIHA